MAACVLYRKGRILKNWCNVTVENCGMNVLCVMSVSVLQTEQYGEVCVCLDQGVTSVSGEYIIGLSF